MIMSLKFIKKHEGYYLWTILANGYKHIGSVKYHEKLESFTYIPMNARCVPIFRDDSCREFIEKTCNEMMLEEILLG